MTGNKKSRLSFFFKLVKIFVFIETVVNYEVKSYPKVRVHTRKYAIIPECTTCAQILGTCYFPIGGMAGVRELVKEGQATANGVIKKATQTVYESSFKMFAEFCLANGYPDPRHHELPAVLVAYLQSISASSIVSLQVWRSGSREIPDAIPA
jgi:hypothetical protein